MAVGVFITFRILDFPDITVDGSFTAGAAAAAVLIAADVHPGLALLWAFCIGAMAGMATGIPSVSLAGIATRSCRLQKRPRAASAMECGFQPNAT